MKTVATMLITPLTLLLLSGPGSAREIDNIDQLTRETRITEEVMRGALRQTLRGDVRLTQLSAQYLPRQGVLMTISLNRPWLRYDEQGEPSFEFHGNISIPEIPAMVTSILQDLQINVPPFEPESLEDLRSLREEQRDLRIEARNTRSELRGKRRALVRAEEDGQVEALEDEIERLEKELEVLEEQHENLAAEIETQYEQLRDAPPAPPKPTQAVDAPPAEPEIPVEEVVSSAVCDYGATLKTLSGDEFLTIALTRTGSASYYAFRMEHVRACNRGDMKPERLIDLAYQY